MKGFSHYLISVLLFAACSADTNGGGGSPAPGGNGPQGGDDTTSVKAHSLATSVAALSHAIDLTTNDADKPFIKKRSSAAIARGQAIKSKLNECTVESTPDKAKKITEDHYQFLTTIDGDSCSIFLSDKTDFIREDVNTEGANYFARNVRFWITTDTLADVTKIRRLNVIATLKDKNEPLPAGDGKFTILETLFTGTVSSVDHGSVDLSMERTSTGTNKQGRTVDAKIRFAFPKGEIATFLYRIEVPAGLAPRMTYFLNDKPLTFDEAQDFIAAFY